MKAEEQMIGIIVSFSDVHLCNTDCSEGEKWKCRKK